MSPKLLPKLSDSRLNLWDSRTDSTDQILLAQTTLGILRQGRGPHLCETSATTRVPSTSQSRSRRTKSHQDTQSDRQGTSHGRPGTCLRAQSPWRTDVASLSLRLAEPNPTSARRRTAPGASKARPLPRRRVHGMLHSRSASSRYASDPRPLAVRQPNENPPP